MSNAYEPRLPEQAPTAADLAERDAFAKLAASSLEVTRRSAETWRVGLSAFVTLVTAGVVIKGRDSTSTLTTEWRWAVTVLLGGGLVLAVLGLWQVLGAQAGLPRPITLAEIHGEHVSVAAYEVSIAAAAADRIRWSQRLVASALVLLVAGVIATWWAKTAPPDPPGYLKVTHGETTTCGKLLSGDAGQVRLQVAGVKDPVAVPATAVTNLAVVAACS
jgi:hypothetical protein